MITLTNKHFSFLSTLWTQGIFASDKIPELMQANGWSKVTKEGKLCDYDYYSHPGFYGLVSIDFDSLTKILWILQNDGSFAFNSEMTKLTIQHPEELN
jgi:hypothetical protein